MSAASSGIATDLIQAIQAAAQSGRLTSVAEKNLQAWMTEERFSEYHARIRELIEDDQFEYLNTLFWETVEFGTGGRRGVMGELGSATINDRTIAESAQGLVDYLRKTNGGRAGRAVVACDTRHRSASFARITATTLAANGTKVFLFDGHRSTPELSFAVRHLNCDVGVMISASHNPPADNGFKAYWNTGVQVVAPHDRGIVECVNRVGKIPTIDDSAAIENGTIELVGEDVDRAYVDAVASLSLSDQRDIRAIYTPQHGTGETSVAAVLQSLGFESVQVYEPQRQPDGDFPGVPDQLPNPERPEIFQPVIDDIRESGDAVDLILASDPDADRIAVMARNGAGEFTYLTGNQLGALLTDYILRKHKAAGSLTPDHYVVETLVTSPLIAVIARSYGVRAITDLLVGFKHIGQTMEDLGAHRFLFGAEESIGFLAGAYCRDKDAALGALYVLELAAELRQSGKTLFDRLDELYIKHGYHHETQIPVKYGGPAGRACIDRIMHALREEPPKELGGVRFDFARDYGDGVVRAVRDQKIIGEIEKPRGNFLMFESVPGEIEFSVAARPSGTEPKIKFYFFARCSPTNENGLPRVRRETQRVMALAETELLAWSAQVVAGL